MPDAILITGTTVVWGDSDAADLEASRQLHLQQERLRRAAKREEQANYLSSAVQRAVRDAILQAEGPPTPALIREALSDELLAAAMGAASAPGMSFYSGRVWG